jgi:LysR family glycine cleavage system transcriptional activator
MSDTLPPLALLRTFEVAARHLSFKKAAAELHVTPTAISQQIKSLENHLGVPLFLRLTRALRLSERGATLLPQVRAGLACLSSAVHSVRGAGDVLRLKSPPSLASHWLIPRLADFYRAHPDIQLHLSSSSDSVEETGSVAALATLSRAPGDGRCELAIVYGTGHCARHRVDALLAPDYAPVCAPDFGGDLNPLRTPADLCHQVLLHDDTLARADGAPSWGWDDWLLRAGVACPSSPSGRHFSNAALVLQATLAGQGVALAALPLVAEHLAAGTLRQPFDMPIRSPYGYFLVSHEGTALRPAVVAFRQWLLAQSRAAAV